MKNLLFVLALVFAILFTQTTQAQFFEKLKKKTEEKIKSEGEKRVNEKVDEGVEKGYDEVEKGIENGEDSVMERKIQPQQQNQMIKKQTKMVKLLLVIQVMM
jgi:TolA-binding protein